MTALRFSRIFLLIPIISMFTASTTSLAQGLVLRDQPLQESEKLVTLDVFSEEDLRDPRFPPIQKKEAEVTLGKWHIFSIPPQRSSPSEPIVAPDRSKLDLYLVQLPFTLHEPPGNKYYQKVVFHIELMSRDTTAFDLLPKNVMTQEKITKTYTLSPQLKFKEIEGKLGEVSSQIMFDNLLPVISAFGEGERHFYWVYTGYQNQKVVSGTKYTLTVLEVPQATKSVSGAIYYEIVIARNFLGDWLFKDTKTNRYPITWNLAEAKPLFKVKH